MRFSIAFILCFVLIGSETCFSATPQERYDSAIKKLIARFASLFDYTNDGCIINVSHMQNHTTKVLPIRKKLILAAVAFLLVLVWVGSVSLGSVGITYLRTGAARRLSLAELPDWQAPVCILFGFLVTGVLVWRLRLVHRLVLFVRGTEDRNTNG